MNDILTTVFGRLRQRLHSGAARMLNSDQEAEDALQDAFVRLWQRRRSLSDESQVTGMAVTTVKNICIDVIRSRSAHPQTEVSETLAETQEDDGRQELYAEVMELIESELSERDRRILLMRDRNGYEFDEIAAELNITEGAVRVALCRARKTIRRIYTERSGS